jgi:hypothetical protein
MIGCDGVAPATYPVSGKVVLPGGDVSQLAGSHVEAVQANDLRVLASGEVQDDGSFMLETIFAGQKLEGAQSGEYQVRIVLSDEDRGSKRRRGQVIASRFTRFDKSGLSLSVPTTEFVTLMLARR